MTDAPRSGEQPPKSGARSTEELALITALNSLLLSKLVATSDGTGCRVLTILRKLLQHVFLTSPG